MQLAEHLVGRAEELGSFDRLLAHLDGGASAALELVGEPGIGKTRLLAELASRADARGHTVLSGCATELERDLPFWMFVDALDEYVQGIDPRRLEGLDDDVRAELATVFPSLAALADGGRVAIQHERYRSHRAVRALLERFAQVQPVVLVLDDVHWADAASVELLGALLHRPPVAPVLIAMAVRPRQMPDRLSAALERADRRAALVRAEVGALTRAEARELLGQAVDEAEGAALYEESGGNPFYLEQLAGSADRSETFVAGGSDVSLGGTLVPRSVAAALVEELGLLSQDARLVLEGAAVAGDPFEPELAAAAAGIPEATAIAALSELLRLGLVRTTEVPRRFRFRHPLVRRTVYESTPGGWRIAAHERTAAALAASGASAMARAHHVEYSARGGDLSAVAVLQEAADAAAHRAPASAERWLGAALRLLPDTAPAEERLVLLLARSKSLAATGHFTDSHAMLIESLRIVPPEANTMRLQLTATCAAVEHQSGRHRQAHARLENALAEIPDPDGPEAVALMIDLAVDGLFGMRYDEMQAWATRAVERSAPLTDRALRAAALAMRAFGAALAGLGAEAQRYREEAAELIDELSDEELARRLDALANLATADFYLDHFEASGSHAERALTIGRATGQGELFPLIGSMLGASFWVRGQMVDAGEVLDGALEAARLVDNIQGTVWHLFNRSFAALAAGDIELALSLAEESFELAKHLDDSPVTAHAAVAFAAALLETGEPARAADVILASAGGDELRAFGGGFRARYLELLTRCLLGAGRRPEAERAAAAAQACADEVDLAMAGAMAGCAKAALDLDAGKPASAAETALAAALALEGVGDAYDAATSRMLAGRAFSQAGENDRAAAEFERAANAFDSFGSIRYRDEAERELRKLGRPTHRRSRRGKANGGGVETLSGRELQVARLVVDRKTNREIAADLFLSPKTVETHIRNSFRKLGVGSRAELARAVERADRRQPELSRRT